MMTHSLLQKNNKHDRVAGFAMLFTVLIVSIILTIALGISSVSYKQTLLSGMVRDSQIAFYQADSGAECARSNESIIYNDGDSYSAPRTITCPVATIDVASGSVRVSSHDFNLVNETSVVYPKTASQDYFAYEDKAALDPQYAAPCFVMVIDKSNIAGPIIRSYGYNTCNPNSPRRLERAIQVSY